MFLTQPRFWAEEGRVFFKFAYLHDFFTGLLYVPVKITGYFLLCATLPATLASRLPLEEAPTFTTFFCFFFVLCVFAVILHGRSYVWDSVCKKLIASTMLMCAAVLAREAWLNTINLQLFCGIFAICLLAEDLRAPGRFLRYLYRVLLLFCGLSGLYAVATLPAYLLKAAREKSRESWILTIILCLCAATQGVIFLVLKAASSITPLKMLSLPIQHRAFLACFYHILDPFLGRRNAFALLDFFHISRTSVSNEVTPPVVLAGWISILFYTLILYWLLKSRRNRIQAPLIVAFSSVTALTAFGATFGVPAERYAVVPFFAFAVLLLNNLSLTFRRPLLSRRSLSALAPGIVLVLALPVAAHNFLHIQNNATYTPQAPLWRQEIRQWRSEPHRAVTIFPHPRWTFYLPDRKRLFEANRSLSTLRGKSISSDSPIEFSDPALRDISWEVIVYITLESDTPLNDLSAELYLAGPSERFVFRRAALQRDTDGKRYRLTFSQATDPKRDDPDLLERFRRVDTLGLALSADQEKTFKLTRIALSSYHRRALVYF